MCSKIIPIMFPCMNIRKGRALVIILVGPYGSQRYAGESDSSILLYCSAPKGVSEISCPGSNNLFPPPTPVGDHSPSKSRAHLAFAAALLCACAAAGAGARASMQITLASVRTEIGKRLFMSQTLLLRHARIHLTDNTIH